MTVRFNGTADELSEVIIRLSMAKADLYHYFREAELCKEGYVDGAHIKKMCDTIMSFLKSDKKILVVSCPPRHGKSTLFSELLPCWYLSNNPQKEVIVCAYSQTQARKMLRACRMRFDEKIRHRIWHEPKFDVDSADELQLAGKLNGRPSIIGVGVGAGLTGNGADLLICDDLIKSYADASSPTISDNVWQWYQSAVLTRLSPQGKCVCVFTRWVPDDVIGRVLTEFPSDMVEYLNLPAISPEGKALWPERYSIEALDQIRRSVSTRVFESLYQGNPVPMDGDLIKREWFNIVDEVPEYQQRVRSWDLAGTEGSGDWTAGALISFKDGVYTVEDVVHVQYSPARMMETIRATAERDGTDTHIVIEEQAGASGKALSDAFARLLSQYAVHFVRPTGNKVVRAQPMIAGMENGHVQWVKSPRMDDIIYEFVQFDGSPSSEKRHDDIVDAVSQGYNWLSENQGDAGGFWIL